MKKVNGRVIVSWCCTWTDGMQNNPKMFPKNLDTTFGTIFTFKPLNGRMLVNFSKQMLISEMIMIQKRKWCVCCLIKFNSTSPPLLWGLKLRIAAMGLKKLFAWGSAIIHMVASSCQRKRTRLFTVNVKFVPLLRNRMRNYVIVALLTVNHILYWIVQHGVIRMRKSVEVVGVIFHPLQEFSQLSLSNDNIISTSL